MATAPQANSSANDDARPVDKIGREFSDINQRLSNEIVIAFVGPVGSGCTTTYEAMADVLAKQYLYDPVYIRFSELIKDHAGDVGHEIPNEISVSARIDLYQTIGNDLRGKFGDAYLADRAIERIAVERDQRGGYKEIGTRRVVLPVRRVYFLDSLKNPAELKRLRQVYGDLLWVISVFSPDEVRSKRLVRGGMSDSDARHAMERDYEEEERSG